MKSSTVVFLVAAVVGSTFAYNFGESLLDALVAKEVHSASGPVVARFVREAEAASSSGQSSANDFSLYHKMMTCCKSGSLDLFRFKDVMLDCFDEFYSKTNVSDDGDVLSIDMFSCEKSNRLKTILVCTSHCAGVRLKLFDEDGKPQTEGMRNMMKQTMQADDWVKRIADKTIDTCAKSLNNTLWPTADTGEMKCRTSAVEFKHCLWVQTEMNCPEADRKSETAYCKRVQDNLDKLRSKLEN